MSGTLTSCSTWRGSTWTLCACTLPARAARRPVLNRASAGANWARFTGETCLVLAVSGAPFSYTKPRGQLPDYEAPVVLKRGKNTVEDFCNSIHKSLKEQFK